MSLFSSFAFVPESLCLFQRSGHWECFVSTQFGREFTPIKHPDYAPDRGHPEYYPAFYSRYFFFDDEENLWLRQYVKEGIELSIYDVFSPEGIYLKHIHVPHHIYELWKGKAYTIIRTEDDFRVLKCFRLVEHEEENDAD